MKAIVIGKGPKGNVEIDLDILLRTRLLIQGGSGSGKSFTVRRLVEQLFGKVQIIVVDVEGEFSTLRETYDFVLVGKGGDTPADCRSAALVAHRLLELGASAVCDIYEMKPAERHRWVRLFLEALIDAPKNLWHPLVVIVDESHTFCPEKGAGESEASDAMISLATRGRKRGFCAVFATQRLGKLRKDAAAELSNVLIGGTFMDIDRKRAAEVLGVAKSDERKFFDELKVLEPGKFYGLGRAISTDRVLIKVGPVSTTHPEPGSSKHSAAPPPPTERVRKLLPKLEDLPKEAEQKARTEADLKAEIRSLKSELLAAKTSAPKEVVRSVQKVVEKKVQVLKDSQISRIEKIVEKIGKSQQVLELSAKHFSSLVSTVKTQVAPTFQPPRLTAIPQRREPVKVVPFFEDTKNGDSEPLMAGERRMLTVLAQFAPGARTKSQLGALSGYTPSGGTFSNYFGRLKREQYIYESADGSITITEKGMKVFGNSPPQGPMSSNDLISMWRGKLLAGERKMLDAAVANYPNPISKEQLGQATGYTHTGGTFSNYLGTLRRNALVQIEGEEVKASDTLFSA